MASPEEKYLMLRTYNGNYRTAYLELADHPHKIIGCVQRTVHVHELIPDYDGPRISIDFDSANRAIGVELLYPYSGEDEQ